MANQTSDATFDEEFLDRIHQAVRIGEPIFTLGSQRKPNWITSIEPRGIWVETQRSTGMASGAQLVPASMVLTAWNHLVANGSLPASVLLRELKVHRSAFVCALLAMLPEVEVEPSGPIVLRLGSESIGSAGPQVNVDAVAVEDVPLAAIESERAEYERIGTVEVLQAEEQLVRRFEAYLTHHGRAVGRYRIRRGTSAALYSDLADLDANILYEAKAAPERMSVRLALGQVLDYGRYVDGSRLAVLLPRPPADDLVELLQRYDVGCVVEASTGNFADLTALQRCP